MAILQIRPLNWPYWMRGGLIGTFIAGAVGAFASMYNIALAFPREVPPNSLGALLVYGYIFLVFAFLTVCAGFSIGAFTGWLIQKYKTDHST